MFTATHNMPDLDRALTRLMRRLADPKPFLTVWGQRTAKTARTTARGKGGRRFWREIARSVRVRSVGADTVSVHTAHVAGAQKEFGGTIRPKNAKALTIPVSDEARGKRASEFEGGGRDLFVLGRDKGDTIGLLGYSEGNRFHALFVLRKRVVQDPDPWWPTPAQTLRTGNDEASRWAQRELGRA